MNLVTMVDGKKYQGEWREDTEEMCGWGVLIKSKGKVVYAGWFNDN